MTIDLNYNDLSALQIEYNKVTHIKKENSTFKNFVEYAIIDLKISFELFKIYKVYNRVSKKLVKSWNKIPTLNEEDLNTFHNKIIKVISSMDEIDLMYKNKELKSYYKSHKNFKNILFETNSRLRKAKYKK